MKKIVFILGILFITSELFAAGGFNRIGVGVNGGYNAIAGVWSLNSSSDSTLVGGFTVSGEVDFFSSYFNSLGKALFIEAGYSNYQKNGVTLSSMPFVRFGYKRYYAVFGETFFLQLGSLFGYAYGGKFSDVDYWGDSYVIERHMVDFGASVGAAIKIIDNLYFEISVNPTISFEFYTPFESASSMAYALQIPVTAGVKYLF